MAPNMDATVHAITRYLGDQLGLRAAFLEGLPWQERERLFDDGQMDVCWICGLPYVWKADRENSLVELLAAPVMQASRYQDRPIYFSDVVVRRDGPFQAFADLRGASWAYNERGSHSGYNVVRYHLATLAENSAYFGKVVESGAHQTSLGMILDRQVDASAIDSTVLELELERQPGIQAEIRIIGTLGPSPMPPWLVSKAVPEPRRAKLRRTLLNMHHDAQGRAILATARIARFAAVTDRDYDAIREMARLAEQVTL
ncbi:MAG: PhnD/SsuA/transferrin family substrate-binding protein [Chloroflexi bacterium]|nr:PhnD/SsuA/transferrin family substrate-binding protein [Chloroflexota bacterium]